MTETIPPARVVATPTALQWLHQLTVQHGGLLLHQSGGCCDGSAPMCYPRDEFKLGGSDILLGELEGTPVYISQSQFAYWQHTQLIIDVVAGRGSGFSLESPEGIRFLSRARVFSAAELNILEQSSR